MMEKELEYKNKIKNNIKLIKQKIENAAKKINRNLKDIKFMAVTKNVDPKYVNFAIQEGIDLIGENRVQELKVKHSQYKLNNTKIHFIGHLQTNKVKDILNYDIDCIESVDSLKLAQTISKQCEKNNKTISVFLEINIGEETTKFGFHCKEIIEKVKIMSKFPNIKIEGLMSIKKKKNTIDYFKQMQLIYIDISNKKIDNVNMNFLSMGMSDDFEDAISCGANIIRIGSLLFRGI